MIESGMDVSSPLAVVIFYISISFHSSYLLKMLDIRHHLALTRLSHERK
jgi:hypothetical protein